MGRLGVGRDRHFDDLDHLAATEERGQLGEQVVVAPQHTDAGRAEHLVAGEGEVVDTERLYVDAAEGGAAGGRIPREVEKGGAVRHRLAAVEHDGGADRAGAAGD